MDYLEHWIGAVRQLYYYNENEREFSTQIRLYQSKYDWIGTKQTLVCNKAWLKSISVDFKELLQKFEALSKQVTCLTHQPLSNSSFNGKLTESWGDLADTRTNQHALSKSILEHLKKITVLLNDISHYRITNRSATLKYFYSDDLFEYRNSNEIKCSHGFLHNLVDYRKWLGRAETSDGKQLISFTEIHTKIKEISELARSIYTEENIEKMYITLIMFGLAPSQLETRVVDKVKIEAYLGGVATPP